MGLFSDILASRGGSSSSSAPAGSVDYPDYVANAYYQLLTGWREDVDMGAGTLEDLSPFHEGTHDAQGAVTPPDQPSAGWTNIMDEVMALMDGTVGGGAGSGGNPYESTLNTTIVATNPTTQLALADTEFDVVQDYGNNLDTVEDYKRFAAAAAEAYDENIGELPAISYDPDLQGLKDAFERQQMGALQRAVNRMHAGMSDVNAVHTSSFIVGDAILETEAAANRDAYARQLDLQAEQFRAQLEAQDQTNRDNRRIKLAAMENGASIMANLHQLELATGQFRSQMQFDLTRANIAADQEEQSNQIDLELAAASWEVDTLTRGMNAIGSIGGTAVIPGKLTPGQHALAQFAPSVGLAVSLATAGLGPVGIAAGFLIPQVLGTRAATGSF